MVWGFDDLTSPPTPLPSERGANGTNQITN